MTVQTGDPVQIPFFIKIKFPLLWGGATVYYTDPYQPKNLQSTVFDVHRQGEHRLNVPFVTSYKGEYKCYITHVVLYDPLKIFIWKIKTVKSLSDLKPNLLVLPRIYPVTLPLPGLTGTQETNRVTVSPPEEECSVSENRLYVQGDPLKRVNWKTSVRMKKLYVKVPDIQQANELNLYIGAVSRQENGLQVQQQACEAAASIASYYLHKRPGSIRTRSYLDFTPRFFGGSGILHHLILHLAKTSYLADVIDPDTQLRQLNALTLLKTSQVLILPGQINPETVKAVAALPQGSTVVFISEENQLPGEFVKNLSSVNEIKIILAHPQSDLKLVLSLEGYCVQTGR
jgi:hypothetical protein